jgi:acyl carrier protein
MFKLTTAPQRNEPPTAEMAAELIRFINEVLPEIHSGLRERPHIDQHTCLFESGLIDSLGILHLMAFVERATGRKIPPRMVVMKHFRTVEAICQAFGHAPGEHGDRDHD